MTDLTVKSASPQQRRSLWAGFALTQLLSLAFLGACLWWVAREVAFVLANDRITASLSVEGNLGSVLTWQLAAFGGALLLVHLLLGFLAFALARLTEASFPGATVARREWLITGWFALLAGLAMAANTTWHPSSIFAAEESWWRGTVMGLRPVQIAVATIALVVLGLAVRAAPRLRLRVRLRRPASAIVAATALVAIAVALVPPRILVASAPTAAGIAPNVVIIGIDSLRNDLSIPRRGDATIPNIAEFLGGARRFNDSVSPLPRTFGAWVSILTGRHPVITNARVNLMPRKLVNEGETLAGALRKHGYRSIYATDEVRFANIDRSFGFDELITPPMGAVDFLLGYAGDIPLVNLVASTQAGRQLFPSNHANRAAHVTYRPRQFVERLAHELSIEGPSLLAIHLTLAHWPYSWAGMPKPTTPEAYRDAYDVAIAGVDRQFRDVMTLLADKHVLDNAIVVLLSDHGEALGAENDSMLRGTGTSREIWDSLWGHGTSVMSPHQYSVLLAMRAYGRATLPGPEQNYDWPVSLEDLRPTLEHYATGRPPDDVDGVSLLPYIADPSRATELASRVRFTETDFNTPSTLAGRYEASGLIDEAAVFYELDRESGWVQFRSNKLPELIARKQRAALSSQSLLAAIPGPPGSAPRYLYTARHNPLLRTLDGPPDATRDPEARRLWDALHARFPGELPTDPELPRM
ncbi:MAG: sulfatase-like hydrolase/transferase [Steroidobacteraceae bacterium]